MEQDITNLQRMRAMCAQTKYSCDIHCMAEIIQATLTDSSGLQSVTVEQILCAYYYRRILQISRSHVHQKCRC